MKKPIGSTLRLAALVLLSTSWIGCDTVIKETGTLSGMVREAGAETPLPGISVALGNAQTTTDPQGRFAFREVSLGLQTLQVSTAGFDAYTKRVDVQAGGNSVDVSLARTTYFEFSSTGYGDDYGIHIPPGVSTYRGVIFLAPAQAYDTRGFASGTPRMSGHPDGFNALVAEERERSLVLAEKYGLALMGADVSALSETAGVLAALEHVAEASGHPELAQAPLLAVGFSFGGCFAYEFTLHHSARVIGFMTQKGRCHSLQDAGPARLVPGYLFVGAKDTVERAEHITQLFRENRRQGALWALAVEPGVAHIPISDQPLLTHWMDTILEARLPETVAPGEPVALKTIDEASGWLGHQGSFAIAAYASYDEDKLQASWLPSMQTAQDWQALVSSPSVTITTTYGNTR
jgi:dienelactone hydrolase